MDKHKLITVFRENLQRDLVMLKAAALATAEAATHEESKPENEYDTRGLEASYLAGAQSKRIVETEEILGVFKQIEPKSFAPDEAINSTAIVEVEAGGKTSFFFILPLGGGLTAEFEGKRILIVTPKSPLGEALIGLKVGQVAAIERGEQILEYEILSIK